MRQILAMSVSKDTPDGQLFAASHTEGDVVDGFQACQLVYLLLVLLPRIVVLCLSSVPQQAQGLVCVALAHGTIACHGEVDIVTSTGTSVGGDDVGRRYDAGQLGYHSIVPRACATHVSIHRLASQQGDILCLQLQVVEQTLIDGLHLLQPLLIAIVRLSLV